MHQIVYLSLTAVDSFALLQLQSQKGHDYFENQQLLGDLFTHLQLSY